MSYLQEQCSCLYQGKLRHYKEYNSRQSNKQLRKQPRRIKTEVTPWTVMKLLGSLPVYGRPALAPGSYVLYLRNIDIKTKNYDKTNMRVRRNSSPGIPEQEKLFSPRRARPKTSQNKRQCYCMYFATLRL